MKDARVQAEIDYRASLGMRPRTVREIDETLRAIGYRLDRRADCAAPARYMDGPRAGESYPCVTTGVCEVDTGLSAYHVDARRDAKFDELQRLRRDGLYAVVPRGILDV